MLYINDFAKSNAEKRNQMKTFERTKYRVMDPSRNKNKKRVS